MFPLHKDRAHLSLVSVFIGTDTNLYYSGFLLTLFLVGVGTPDIQPLSVLSPTNVSYFVASYSVGLV